MERSWGIRPLGHPDGYMSRRITKAAWGQKVSWDTLNMVATEHGVQGLLAFPADQSPMNVRALVIYRHAPMSILWWCALPGDEIALPTLFNAISKTEDMPFTLRIPDVSLDKLQTLKESLKNFTVKGYTGAEAFISYDPVGGPEDYSPNDGSGPDSPPDVSGETAARDKPRRPEPTVVPVVRGNSRGI